MACAYCHVATTGDVEDYGNGTADNMMNNGKVARLDNAQLFFSGHAKAGGTYDKTNHPAANFGQVTSVVNLPRQLQFGLRLSF